MDVAYGDDSRLRAGMTALGVPYVAGIQPNTLKWRSGTGPRRKGKPLNNGPSRRARPDLGQEVMQACPNTPGARSDGGKARPMAVLALCARARGVGHNELDPGSAAAKSGC